MPRVAAVGALATASALVLSGCALSSEPSGDYLTTVPEVLEQSSLAPTDVLVGTSLDGFVRTVSVTLNIETDTVTTAQITEVLDLVAGTIDQPGASEFEVSFMDMRTVTPVDTQVSCEAIPSSSVSCSQFDTSLSLDALNEEFGS